MEANSARIAKMRQCLEETLHPTALTIFDESHLHANHEGAKSGRGHFKLEISAPDLVGKSRIEQHRIIYSALGSLMQTEIHALRICVI